MTGFQPGVSTGRGWLGLASLTAAALAGMLWVGCSSEPVPAPAPVETRSAPPGEAPSPVGEVSAVPPAQAPEGIRVRVPAWLDGGARKELLSRVSGVFPGREIQLVEADDPVRNRKWNLALLSRGSSHPSTAPGKAWVVESLACYVNTTRLRAQTPSPLTTWEGVAQIAARKVAGATAPRSLALPGDPPGLTRTLEALASLAGATSGTRLADPRVARALDYLAELQQKGLLAMGEKEGLSAAAAAGMVATGQADMTLGWDTDMAWIADRTKSPLANRIEVLDPPSFQDYPRAKGKPTRVWCWTARATGGATQALESLVDSLTLWDPGSLPGGKWIGGVTESASFPAPSDLFVFDLHPGQDYRDTTTQLREGWKVGAKSLDLLRAFEIRFAQIQKELESGAAP